MSKISFSKIGLGTVEIGIADYGVGKTGLIAEEDAITLLKQAAEMGVTYIDTARGYGLAEERIGKSGVAQQGGVVVGTKCGQWIKDAPDLRGEELEKKIREDIETSRQMLKLDVLPLVQLHLELPDYQNLPEVWEILQKIKSEGKIEVVGIATRGENMPQQAMDLGFATLQTAYSILDQRMAEKVLPQAAATGTQVINRSVLLKGVLTPARENLPEELAPLKANADAAGKIADELGISLPDLAIRFCLSNSNISTALVGTTKPEEIESALTAANAGPLSNETLSALYELGITDSKQVDPSQW